MHSLAPVLVLLSLCLGALTTGCDPGAGVIYVNQTDRNLRFYGDDAAEDFMVELQPHSSVDAAVLEHLWTGLVVVKDTKGRTLLRRELTWEELEAQDFRIVVRPEDIATPTSTPEG
jgi:hypothetical protein